MTHEMYTQIEDPLHTLSNCPVCGAKAELYRYSEGPDEPTEALVCCSHGEQFGPQEGLAHCGCLLYMPPNDFYFPTIRQAVAFWNSYAYSLNELRAKNERTIS